MTRKINIRPLAELEISEAYFYFETKRQGLGDEFLARLDDTLGRISESPELYALEKRGVRKVRLRQFPYVLGYYIDSEQIVVLGLLHGSRDPKMWNERL
jgi:toxin ParE1/3/4